MRVKRARSPRGERYKRQRGHLHCGFVSELFRVDTRPPPIDPVGTRCELYLTPKKSEAMHYRVDLDGHSRKK